MLLHLPPALLITLVFLGVSPHVVAGQSSDHSHESPPAQIARTEIAPGAVMLSGSGGNILLSHGADGIVLIDDEWPEMSAALKAVLADYGGVESLEYIINTHWHRDHAGGNIALGVHAPIIAHRNARVTLAAPQTVEFFNMQFEPMTGPALPTITYDSAMALHLNGETFQLFHLPGGHTDGDTAVQLEQANVLHSGDIFVNGSWPFIDLEHGGNVIQLTENAANLLDRIDANTIIIPGHGPVADRADLERYLSMLRATTAEVRAMRDSGMSLEQAQQQGLQKQWSSWARGFISEPQWIALVYGSLAQTP